MSSGKAKTDEVTRLAIVNPERCKPKKCGQECKASCPVNKTGKRCIVIPADAKKAAISEKLCIGCDICIKRCPFDAIRIINLPSVLDSQVSYRYGLNSFRLHRVPIPKPGQVLGLVGENGIGKSTALKILSGDVRPNFGDLRNPEPEWSEVCQHYRGSELQAYFSKIADGNFRPAHKIQYVDAILKTDQSTQLVTDLLRKRKKKNPEAYDRIIKTLNLEPLLNRQLKNLSGGELQRFALGFVALDSKADIYLIDEPSSYLDVRQRLTAGKLIRSLIEDNIEKYCVVVEHDLAVLDYLSDYTCVLYGQAGVFGVISMPFSVRDGINIFLSGFLPTENMRFRDDALKFQVFDNSTNDGEQEDDKGKEKKKSYSTAYPSMEIRFGTTMSDQLDATDAAKAAAGLGAEQDLVETTEYEHQKANPNGFTLQVEAGSFEASKICLLLGENGMGKTTFIKALAGVAQPIKLEGIIPLIPFSIKPQTISPSFPGTVSELFNAKIPETFNHPGFTDDVVRPLDIKHLMDRTVKNLSGGELQRVAIILALGKPADMYLIDEPSAYLDASQRLVCAKVIKRFIMNAKKSCFVVEHDFLMALYLADNVVVFTGEPGVKAVANRPCSVIEGFNKFLSIIQVTFRRDPESLRPRVNKMNSAKDREQRMSGQYFTNFTDDA